MATFIWILLLLLIAKLPSVFCEDCPRLPEKGNQTWPYLSNPHSKDSTRKSEFLCDFVWTDAEHLDKKLLDRLTKRQKNFVRFTVPVVGYNNPYLQLSNYSGYLTWAWVLDTHSYMLYYPHNFIMTSLLTMGIITQDWAIDYQNSNMSLRSFGVDHDNFDTHDIVGHCITECVEANQSCGIGKYELEKFLLNFTRKRDKFKWSWLCLEAPYDVKDIVSVPQFAFPDLLYYWRFLKMFFTRRHITRLGKMQSKTDFPHYYCYNKEDKCELMELLSHYWVITFIGFLLWLYSPLLIHYLPSSAPKKRKGVPKGMFPSYKTPIYFGRCIKLMLCFYKQKGLPKTKLWILLRRILFLLALAMTSFRLFIQPSYYYYSWPLLALVMVAVILPTYLSEYITAELPTKFLFWDLPLGLVRAKENLTEYQQLAYVMQERLYLTVDINFWKFVLQKSYRSFFLLIQRPTHKSLEFLLQMVLIPLSLLLGTLIFTGAVLVNALFYFTPLLYFYTTLMRGIFMGEWQFIQTRAKQASLCWAVVNTILVCCHTVVLVFALHYALVATYIWCFAISEFTMFTFIGGALTSSMAFQYFVLTGSVVAAVYTLVRDLHKDYDSILKEIVDILKNDKTFVKLQREVNSISGNKNSLEKEELKGCQTTITVHHCSVPHSKLLIDDNITAYLDKGMFDNMVESCKPLRRQIFFVILKIIAIFFYGLVAFWVKNVFHLEDKVGGIFKMVVTVAVYFLPSLLQFISYKSHFGKKTEVVLKQEIYQSLVTYLSEIS